MAFLPNGSIPYQQYIKSRTPSLAGYLKSLGYATYAQHPYQASGWSRDKVYPLLGFDNLDFMEDYRDVSYVRNYISDASDMEHIIETYEKNKASGKPAFIFNVTMQNHGGYTDTYMNLTNDIQSQYASEPLNQYLTLIHKTDQALENLIDYFPKWMTGRSSYFSGIISRMIQWLLSWKTGHRQRHKNVISYLIWCGVIMGSKERKIKIRV